MSRPSLGPCAQLTCETCKRRKVKCDKLRPCTACRRANIHCVAVERARLPRGRSAKQKNTIQQDMVLSHQSPDLSSRVEMLEGLVRSLLDSRTQTSLNDTRQLSPSLLGDLDQCFFPSEVDSQNDHDDASPSTATPPQTNDTLTVLDQQLLQIYVTHVDPIFPILQCSSLRGYVTKGLPYLTYAVDHPAPKALVCAIGYIAITTLSDSACSQELSLSRDLLLDRYHSLTEHALEQADYYNSDDLTVLQAFVLFLVSLQAHDRSRRPWTMLSLAVRIAQSLYLDKSDPPFPVTPLEREMRSRLWHLISLLDVQASFDRGLAPMLHADCLKSQAIPAPDILDYLLPLDDDGSLLSGSTLLADPKFLMVMAEAASAFRSLDLSVGTYTSFIGMDVHSRLQTATTFQQGSQAILNGFQLVRTASHLFLEKVASVTYLFLQLVAVQPVEPNHNSRSSRCLENQNISLSLAVNFLRALKDLYLTPQVEHFRWYLRLFVPWHAFAVAMEQVCTCYDSSLQAYYYALIRDLYSSLQALMGDAHQKILQQPLQRFIALPQTCMNPALSSDNPLAPGSLQLY
ncbi:Transcription factor vrtR2 [Talaromyces pinophilus]|nr:Transcription factor vrtR2 [Talaromyces pinophilus]